ncbi:unnamed protein product [Danaus chrysippus]|uniref:(African queen) hypothetical protein n=1 Tax=Danaus chrysippus TaxID=151541 RepID=A0A8J2VQE5_9NEOP|nr:unnamed protein product [Danaus chrysippus]
MLFTFVLNLGILFVIQDTFGINFIDWDTSNDRDENHDNYDINSDDVRTTREGRRYWLVSSDLNLNEPQKQADEEEKDERLKSKITTLVEQTLHDTQTKIDSIQHLKEQHRNEAPYKTGFILSMIKKSKDVLNELFNVAVKHREDWKALEQMKVFELIVHTNVDTTNLVRQLVEIHIQHMNATIRNDNKRRVVLI